MVCKQFATAFVIIILIISTETRVSFDGNNCLTIRVGEIYKAADSGQNLVGLCGNYDGDAQNDLGDASVAKHVDTFKYPEKDCKPVDPQHLNLFESLGAKQRDKVRGACRDFSSDPIFEECTSKVKIEPLYNMCLFSLGYDLGASRAGSGGAPCGGR